MLKRAEPSPSCSRMRPAVAIAERGTVVKGCPKALTGTNATRLLLIRYFSLLSFGHKCSRSDQISSI
jgi:hypothetical protein